MIKDWVALSGEFPPSPIKMPKPLWQVLHGRGMQTQESIENHLAPSLKDLSHPLSLHDMEKAVDRLIKAFIQKEKICIYGDFDLDGTPGLALLQSGLSNLGFNDLIYYQPKRLSEGYGFHKHAVDQFEKEGVSLIVTVDVGITDIETVQYSQNKNIDVIITDHHLPKEEEPPAFAIVNPNKTGCSSGLGHLAGTGVAFYLILALKNKMSKEGLFKDKFDPKKLLDLFAIGTLTDMVPLIHENRSLVKHGLVELSKTQRPGLKALLKALDIYNRPLSSHDVGFKLAPKLNALSRLEERLLPIDILMAESEGQAAELVDEVLEVNERRVQLQKKAFEEACEKVNSNSSKDYIWVYSKDYHQGVIGLVATKLAQKYSRPSFVGCVKNDGSVVGSSRLPNLSELNLVEILGHCSGSLEKFGGHAAAAGFELKLDEVENFNELLGEHFSPSSEKDENVDKNIMELLNENSKAPTRSVAYYDAVSSVEDFTPDFMSWYENMGPFGQNFEAPTFYLPNVELKSLRELRGGHLKLDVSSRTSPLSRTGLWFSPPREHPELQKELKLGEIIDLLVEPQWNHFAGKKSLQLLIKDIRRTK